MALTAAEETRVRNLLAAADAAGLTLVDLVRGAKVALAAARYDRRVRLMRAATGAILAARQDAAAAAAAKADYDRAAAEAAAFAAARDAVVSD